MNKISIVLPLKINANTMGSDLERVKKILLPSLIKYFNLRHIHKFLIITPANEQAEVAQQLKEYTDKLNLSVISEEEVLASIPGWKKHVIIHKKLSILKKIDQCSTNGKLYKYLRLDNSWYTLIGWSKQQIIKLISAKFIETDYYMTIDSDICLTHQADFDSLFLDGKAIFELEAFKKHYEWWVGSAQVLGINLNVKKEDSGLSVTPEILSTQIVTRLINHLLLTSRKNKYPTVFEFLSSHKNWTEYTLYWLFLLEFYKKEDFYTNKKPLYRLHSVHCVWNRNQAPDIQTLQNFIDDAFRNNNALFLIIQSACIPLIEYYDSIKQYLLNLEMKS